MVNCQNCGSTETYRYKDFPGDAMTVIACRECEWEAYEHEVTDKRHPEL